MKFPRNARIFQGQLDAAPFASVFFLLVLFVLLGSLVYTPGVRVRLELPRADGLPGVEGPTIPVAVDRDGHFYFQNQRIGQDELESRLRAAASETPRLTLVVQADKEVTDQDLIGLAMLARRAGIEDLLLATLPRVFPATPPSLASPP